MEASQLPNAESSASLCAFWTSGVHGDILSVLGLQADGYFKVGAASGEAFWKCGVTT
jgi:hypothetical protein